MSTAGVPYWTVTATITVRHTADSGSDRHSWESARQVPTFHLSSAVHGIVDADHAERIARSVVMTGDVMGTIVAASVSVAPAPIASVFVVRPTYDRDGIQGVFGTLDTAVQYAADLADRENARPGGNAHLRVDEWSGNLLLRSVHVYGTDHPMNGPF